MTLIDADGPEGVRPAPARYRRRSLVRELRDTWDYLDLNRDQVLIVAVATAVAVAFLIRLLWATTPEFRDLVLTVVGCAGGGAAVVLVAWKVARGEQYR